MEGKSFLERDTRGKMDAVPFSAVFVLLISIYCLSSTAYSFFKFVGMDVVIVIDVVIDVVYPHCSCHVSLQLAGLEKGIGELKTPVATGRREKLDTLLSSHVQALWKHILESDTASLLFRGSPVGTGLENNASGYVARRVMKDVCEHLYYL